MGHFVVPLNTAISFSATLPAFNCSALLGTLLPYDASTAGPKLSPALFGDRKAVHLMINQDDLSSPINLQCRIDEIAHNLQRKQAETPLRCIRAGVDYILTKSIPAKLCRAAQQIDLSFIRSALTGLGYSRMKEQKPCRDVCMNDADYDEIIKKSHKNLSQIDRCEFHVIHAANEEYLFPRMYQESDGTGLFSTADIYEGNAPPPFEEILRQKDPDSPIQYGSAGMSLYA